MSSSRRVGRTTRMILRSSEAGTVLALLRLQYLAQKIGRNVELADLRGIVGKVAEGERHQLAGLHADRGERLQHFRIGLLEGFHHRRQRIGLRVGLGLGVGRGKRHQIAVLLLQRDFAGHLLPPDLQLPFLHGALGFHLRLAHLPPLVLQRDLGGDLVFLDRPLLFDGGIAPAVDGLVGLAEQGLAGLRFQRLGRLGLRHDGEQRQAEDFEAERFDRRVYPERFRHAGDQRLARGKNLLERQHLHLGTHRHLHAVDHPGRKLLRIFRDITALAVEREIQEGCRAARLGDAVGDLPLHGHFLEVRRHQRKDEGVVDARRRHQDQRARWREMPEGQARTFADGGAVLILDDVLRRFRLDEAQSEHDRFLVPGTSPLLVSKWRKHDLVINVN
ncbi:hypothetical protein RHECNPAF_14110032 [Rhizobium etli CNPAF512]|nr:hypothetical protein RHECNPAF_14110032 [Rhizobium etli CNPAF512]